MNAPKSERPSADWRQMLAAYADGELAECDRMRVESWLRMNPSMAEELSAQNEFSPRNSDYWSSVDPPNPTQSAWAAVWNKVERGIDNFQPRVQPHRTQWWRRGLIAVVLAITPTAAAAVLVGVAMNQQSAVETPVSPRTGESIDEPFTVATTSDVEILSVRDADAPFLVVGDAPLNEPVSLANADEVRLDGIRPDWDGAVPNVQLGGGAGAPMVFPALNRKP